jgi:hypothetical protein
LNILYPSKGFLHEAKKAFNRREILEVSIKEGWRTRVLAREVESWVPVGEAVEIGGGVFKGPSIICGLSMLSLIVVHYFALSGNYEMHSKVNGNSVVLIYVLRM